jgi:hypothetical protein
VTTPEDHPLPDSGGRSPGVRFTVDETGKLSPGVTFNTPMRKPCFLIEGSPTRSVASSQSAKSRRSCEINLWLARAILTPNENLWCARRADWQFQ